MLTCTSVRVHLMLAFGAVLQERELDMLPSSEQNLEATAKDVQAKLEVIKQLQPLWLRSSPDHLRFTN